MKINIQLNNTERNIFNVPFFIFRNPKSLNRGKLSKLFFLTKVYIIILLFNALNKNLFCKAMNFFYKEDGSIIWDSKEKLYIKSFKNQNIYYPNKYRIAGSMVNHQYELDNLLDSYCLNGFELNPNDVVVDCGANVGNFYLALKQFEKNFVYHGYEPDSKVFKCLELNLNNKSIKVFNKGLSSTSGTGTLYLGSNSGDSSVEKFNSNNIESIELTTLDNENYSSIKLLKIDAEGHELEVLIGGEKILKNIQYVSVDMGAEKGIEKKNTVVEVTNFLFNHNFELIKFNDKRITGLFRNKFFLLNS